MLAGSLNKTTLQIRQVLLTLIELPRNLICFPRKGHFRAKQPLNYKSYFSKESPDIWCIFATKISKMKKKSMSARNEARTLHCCE